MNNIAPFETTKLITECQPYHTRILGTLHGYKQCMKLLTMRILCFSKNDFETVTPTLTDSNKENREL
jgi:hypothetical protein